MKVFFKYSLPVFNLNGISYKQPVMNSLCKIVAFVAALGFLASLCLFVGSFLGARLDNLNYLWFVSLHVGTFALLLPMFALEHRAIRDRTFFWKEFGRGRPSWVIPTIKILALFFAINFGVFLLAAHAASPEIKDGEYVLNNHGEIIKILTRPEYLRLKGGELRLFASGWMFFYFVPLSYWWFSRPRNA
jgi:hypothetical protein